MKNVEKFIMELALDKPLCKIARENGVVEVLETGTCVPVNGCKSCIMDVISWLNQEAKPVIPEGTLVWVTDGLLLSGDMPHINIRRYRAYEDGKHWCYAVDDTANWIPWKHVEVVKEGIV